MIYNNFILNHAVGFFSQILNFCILYGNIILLDIKIGFKNKTNNKMVIIRKERIKLKRNKIFILFPPAAQIIENVSL